VSGELKGKRLPAYRYTIISKRPRYLANWEKEKQTAKTQRVGRIHGQRVNGRGDFDKSYSRKAPDQPQLSKFGVRKRGRHLRSQKRQALQ